MTDHEVHGLLSYLRERRQDMVDLLQRLALAESPSDNPAAVAPVLAMLASELEQAGMCVQLLPGRVSASTSPVTRKSAVNRKSPSTEAFCPIVDLSMDTSRVKTWEARLQSVGVRIEAQPQCIRVHRDAQAQRPLFLSSPHSHMRHSAGMPLCTHTAAPGEHSP